MDKITTKVLTLIISVFSLLNCQLLENADNPLDPTSSVGISNSLILMSAVNALLNSGSETLLESDQNTSNTYSVTLTEAPTSDVTITLTNTDEQLLINGATSGTITITSANYSTAQEVSITARDDYFQEGDHTGTLNVAVESSDPAVDAGNFADVTFSITDNDTISYNLTQSASTVMYGGNDITITVTPSLPPVGGDLTISFSGLATGEGSIDKTSLTFTQDTTPTVQQIIYTPPSVNCSSYPDLFPVITTTQSGATNYTDYNPADISITVSGAPC